MQAISASGRNEIVVGEVGMLGANTVRSPALRGLRLRPDRDTRFLQQSLPPQNFVTAGDAAMKVVATSKTRCCSR